MESCCNSPEVPGDNFFRSYDAAADGKFSDISFPATVSDFRLDKYEVTVGRFRTFVESGMGTQLAPPAPGAGAHPNLAGSGWDLTWDSTLPASKDALLARVKCDASFQTWTDAPGANENHPMNCVNWYEAMAFCVWDGGYLPSEAEWNFAAAGGQQQRAYPWSSPPGSVLLDSDHASYSDGTNCVGDGMPGCMPTDILPVGSKPLGDGLWGQSDLAGNLTEFVLDWAGSYQTPCDDCASVTQTADTIIRVFRGGGYGDTAMMLRTGDRNFLDAQPSDRASSVGFRCARAP